MSSESTKFYSMKQESAIASALGWSRVTGSGARINYPGDVCSDEWMGECKTHTTPGHPVIFNFAVWDKIEKEAMSQFKQPILFVDDGSQDLAKTWCMIDVTRMTIPETVELDLSESKSFRVDNTAKMYEFSRNGKQYSVMEFIVFQTMLAGNVV